MGCGHPTRYASVEVLDVYIFVRLWTDSVNMTASQQCKRQSQSFTGMWLRAM